MKVYSTLIATVGASLYGNIMKNDELKKKYEEEKFDDIANILIENTLGDPENERIYGSEINSTISLVKNFSNIESEAKFIPNHLYLLVSDTVIGSKIGYILKNFFKNNKEHKFSNVDVITIKGLTDKDEYSFKKFGLRNVIREFARIAKEHVGDVVVNSTGGYKAQIAFALALGQALKFPVYYRFESFYKIIKMPPLPLSLDWRIYSDNYEFLEALEANVEEDETSFLKAFSIRSYAEIPEVLKVFIDREKIDNKTYLWLSPMGQVFLEASRALMGHDVTLPKSPVNSKKKFISSNKEGHSIQFLANNPQIEKLTEVEWINRIIVQSYSEHFTKNELRAKIINNQIKVNYANKHGKLSFIVEVTAKTKEQLILAKNKLIEYLS